MFDPELYRDKAEVEMWKARDPVLTFADRLRQQNLLSDSEEAMLSDEVARETAEAVAFAEASPEESPETLYRDVTTPTTEAADS